MDDVRSDSVVEIAGLVSVCWLVVCLTVAEDISIDKVDVLRWVVEYGEDGEVPVVLASVGPVSIVEVLNVVVLIGDNSVVNSVDSVTLVEIAGLVCV